MDESVRQRLLKLWENVPETRPATSGTHHLDWLEDELRWTWRSLEGESTTHTIQPDDLVADVACMAMLRWLIKEPHHGLDIGFDGDDYFLISQCENVEDTVHVDGKPSILEALLAACEGLSQTASP
jgi:hypothetical protein